MGAVEPDDEASLGPRSAVFTPSRKTWLCKDVLAEPQNGTA